MLYRLPFPKSRISSPYGMRTNPVTGVRSKHRGTDFRVASGTKIPAIAAGVVEAKGANLDKRVGAGYWIRIRHADGTRSSYYHMLRAATLRVGSKVKAGQTVGYVGSTGASTGPHLHLMLTNSRGVEFDPIPYITNRLRKERTMAGNCTPFTNTKKDGKTTWHWYVPGVGWKHTTTQAKASLIKSVIGDVLSVHVTEAQQTDLERLYPNPAPATAGGSPVAFEFEGTATPK